MTKSREYFISEPAGSNADATIIWLHGLGADGKDFAGLVEELGLPIHHKVRFIFPSAPFANITINNGMLMRAWYDIYDFTISDKEDSDGIKKSQQLINELIQQEMAKGIASERILLGGFSQGGAMSLYAGLKFIAPLGGIICLSAYLPLRTTFTECEATANFKTPVFMAHGMFDPVVSYNLGQTTHSLLTQWHYNVEWKSYPMEHTVCIEELAAIGAFVNRCLEYA